MTRFYGIAGAVALAGLSAAYFAAGRWHVPPVAVIERAPPAPVPGPADADDGAGTQGAGDRSDDKRLADAAQGDAPSDPAAPERAASDPAAPRLDLVRVERDGAALVAGRAPPGAALTVTIDGIPAVAGRADADGSFAFFLELAPSVRPRLLDLTARLPDGREVAAVAQAILAPATPPQPAAVLRGSDARDRDAIAAVAAPGPDAAPTTPAGTEPRTFDAPTRDPPAREADADISPPQGAQGAARPAVLLSGPEGVRLMQSARAGPQRPRQVSIDMIAYDPDGTVTLEGRTATPPPPVDSVRVYLDGAAVDRVAVDAEGGWRLPLRDVPAGIYTLRVDQLDPQGRVTSRIETPFRRESPADLDKLAKAEAATDMPATVVTVQPGATLWGIAADRYGAGMRYVQVFEANADRIRDPDLIYPGQVFDLPPLGGQ